MWFIVFLMLLTGAAFAWLSDRVSVKVALVGGTGSGKSSILRALLAEAGKDTAECPASGNAWSGTQQILEFDVTSFLSVVDLPGLSHQMMSSFTEGDYVALQSEAEGQPATDPSSIALQDRRQFRTILSQLAKGCYHVGDTMRWSLGGLLNEVTMRVQPWRTQQPDNQLDSVLAVVSVKDLGEALHVTGNSPATYELSQSQDLSTHGPVQVFLRRTAALYQDSTAVARAPVYIAVTGADVLDRYCACPQGNPLNGRLEDAAARIQFFKTEVERLVGEGRVIFLDARTPESAMPAIKQLTASLLSAARHAKRNRLRNSSA